MAIDTFINFGDAEVSTGYNASDTSIVLSSGQGARWASLTVPYNVTWWNYTDYPNPTDDPNREIVRVTARSTDTLTVTRGQESITATTKNTASKTYRMLPTLTAKTLNTDVAALDGTRTFSLLNLASTASPGFSFVGDGGSAALFMDSYHTAGSLFRYRRFRNTVAAPRRAQSGDVLLNIQGWGGEAVDDATSATVTSSAATLRAVTTEAFTSTGHGAKFEFQVSGIGETSVATRASIDSATLTLASGVALTGTANLTLAPEPNRGFALLQAENNPTEPGGGTDEHELDLYLFGKKDSVSNYFTGAVTLGATDGTNTASGYSLLNEGNWTSGGGFTLSRFALYDHSADTEVLMHQSSSAGVVQFGRTTNGARSLGLRVTGKEINTDADGTTNSAQFNGHFIKNDTNTRAFAVVKILPSFNFGGSNTNTTVTLLDIDSTNTSLTGATVIPAKIAFGGSELLRLTSVGNLKIGGTASRGTTEGTNQLVLFNVGTVPVGTLSNGASVLALAGRVHALDSGGIEAQLTPHNVALTDNTATTVMTLANANNSAAGGVLTYTIEATDATDYQSETGQVIVTVVNKAGAVTAAVTEVNSQQSVSAGTLTTAWTITAANPAAIQVNANTSLAPSGGYPRIRFRFENTGRQAFTLS